MKSNGHLSDLKLNREPLERIERFIETLTAWNGVHNLTGARSRMEIESQIFDSLYPLTFLDFTPQSLLDIGTGAGFPGLLLAAVWPDASTLLCEPIQKRAAFLRYAAVEMGLENVEVAAARVETLAPRPFSLITSRAVTRTPELIAWCRPFIASGTRLLFYKGERVAEETARLRCRYRVVSRDSRRYLYIKDAATC